MFAKQCSGLGLKVTAASGLDGAIAQALAFKGPSLVEVMTDAELI
jgi:thiamine pyrophosphate-dependent acetolactate synthase large subunit-like protein